MAYLSTIARSLDKCPHCQQTINLDGGPICCEQAKQDWIEYSSGSPKAGNLFT